MLKVNPKYRDLIPPLSSEEKAQLEANCLADGIKHPIITWQGFIIDGHNRWDIVQEHGLDYQVDEMQFDSEDDVLVWMIRNQFGRRNLNAYSRSVLALRMEDVFRAKAKANQGNRTDISQKSVKSKSIDTQKEIAKEANVSHDTIAKVKTIEAEATPEVKAMLANGDAKMSINKAYQSIKEAKKKDALTEAKERAVAIEQSELKNIPTITNMDCLDFLNSFEDGSIDLLITDPPYSTDVDDICSFAKWVHVALKKLSKNGRAYIFTGAYPVELKAYTNELLSQDKFVVDNPLIWSYKNTLGVTPKMKYNLNYQVCWHLYSKDSEELDTSITNEMFSVQEINAPDGRIGDRYHAWQKPDKLANMLVRHSLKEGGLLVDCFACTGAFLIAGAKAGMIAKGCDISQENIDIAIKRGVKYEL